MTDFLLELRSEEIPARMQDRAREDLARLFAAELARAGLAATETVTYATPRRLALIARGLPDATAATSEETKGPKASAPPQALEGFLRRTGLTREQLIERDGVLFAVIDRPGRATVDVLAAAIPAIIRAFPWPKAMRWGAASTTMESLRWVRPLQGIVALFGDAIVECEVAGIESGAATVGHRFHHPGIITLGGADDYVEKLRACHVIVDQAERRQIIALGATMAARKAGLDLVQDEGLLTENAGLTEWPVPLLGRFDPAFLEVPPEVIQLTARVNQKYFVCRDAGGALANAFVCTANIDASDGGEKIVEGNRKVLAARLADAKFFYDTDLKVPLEEQARKLDRYQEKLGTFVDKTNRAVGTADWLARSGVVVAIPDIETFALHARRAASLMLADIPTNMVGEFPELEGLIGSYYAAAQGEPRAVSQAIATQYKPRGPADDVPQAPLSIIQALAFKVETRVAFFVGDIFATGSKDPYGVRRTELGIIRIILENELRLSLGALLEVPFAASSYATKVDRHAILTSFADRLKVQQREAGVRHDLIDAVFALGGEDDLVRLLARVRALQAFVGTADGVNLLAGYKRAANILKKEGWSPSDNIRHPGLEPGSRFFDDAEEGSGTPGRARGDDPGLSYAPEPAETALIAALDSAEPAAAAAVLAEEFGAAMAALASLRAPIDQFFETVTVNDPDADKRAARLALLARVRAAVHAVADFSRIEG